MNNKLIVIVCVSLLIDQKYANAYRQLSLQPGRMGPSFSSVGSSFSSYKPSYKRTNLQLDHVNVPPYSPSYTSSIPGISDGSTLYKPSSYYDNIELPTFGSTSNVDMSHVNDLLRQLKTNEALLERIYADSNPYRLRTIPGNFNGEVVPSYRLPQNVHSSGLDDLILNSRLRANVSLGSNKDISRISNPTFNSSVTPPTRSYGNYNGYTTTTTTEKTWALLNDRSVNKTVINSVRDNLKRNSGNIRRQYTITADAYKNSKSKTLKLIDYDSTRTSYIVHPKQQGQLKFHSA